MMRGTKAVCCLMLVALCAQPLAAGELESAIGRGLQRVSQASANWLNNADCFSCHHQTLPMLTALEGAGVGFELDSDWLKSQAQATHDYFSVRLEDMRAGRHVPGGAATVGYGLWALSLSQHPQDETTAAMVAYLLKIQGTVRLRDGEAKDLGDPKNGRWIASCRRSPLQGSVVGDTVVALQGIERYATDEQRPLVSKARDAALNWLGSTALETHQDRLWRVWGLQLFEADADPAVRQSVLDAILADQRADGGWAETSDRLTDPFTTGQTLVVLRRVGMSPGDPACLRAVDFLLRTQQADGSWRFESHVKPVQPYFDNGDPYERDQFISVAATAWATAGLIQQLQQLPAPARPSTNP